MYILKCPHCDQKASSFLKAYFWGYFPSNQPNKCINCSKPIKYNVSCYFQCGIIFMFLLIVLGKLANPIYSIFKKEPDPYAIVEKVPTFDIFGIAGRIIEIGFVLFLLYISFEIPGKYVGKRVFKKK